MEQREEIPIKRYFYDNDLCYFDRIKDINLNKHRSNDSSLHYTNPRGLSQWFYSSHHLSFEQICKIDKIQSFSP